MVDMLLIDTDSRFAYVDSYVLDGTDHTLLWNGELLGDDELCNVSLKLGGGATVPDVIGNPLSWLICSEVLANKLKNLDQCGIQLLKCRIESKYGEEISGYYVVNVLNVVQALNFENSIYDLEDGNIDMVYEWIFNDSQIPARKMLFREGSFIYAIFSTRSLSFEFSGMSGILFEACETC